MKFIACLLALISILTAGMTFGESSETAEAIPLAAEISLKDFEVSIGSDWIIDETENSEGTLLSAMTIDYLNHLMIYQVEDGGDERAMEVAALNEYAEGVKRNKTQDINGIRMIFAEREDPNAAYVYFSANGHVYSCTMSSSDVEVGLETLQATLYEMSQTITLKQQE